LELKLSDCALRWSELHCWPTNRQVWPKKWSELGLWLKLGTPLCYITTGNNQNSTKKM